MNAPHLKPPLSAADLPPEWYVAVRQAMSEREGVPVRANPLRPSIDFWIINRREWVSLMLPGDGVLFADTEQRDMVLKKLEGK